MRVIALVLFGLSMNVFAVPLSRQAAGDQAAQEFHDLQFFSGGRGMVLSPNLITAYNLLVPGLGVFGEQMMTGKWGFVYDNQNKIAGLHDVEYNGHHIGVIGCVACHSGRAAGQYIVGLGNKNFDVLRLGQEVNKVEKTWQSLVPSITKDQNYIDGENFALQFSEYLAAPNLGNLTEGLVPVSFIRGWFYRILKAPMPAEIPRGQVKIPSLWGYGEKRKVGQFCDGFGDGSVPGWAVAVELTAGQTPENVLGYLDKITSAENLLSNILPPKYPFSIDQNVVAQGKVVFTKTCSGCHGNYEADSDGLAVFEAPVRIPWSAVQTDNDRLLGNTPEFVQLVKENPLNDLIKANFTDPGYFSPRLVGIWARFPYLHNASVPSLADMLTPEATRPKLFSLKDAGERSRFDPKRVGLSIISDQSLLHQQKKDSRSVYDTQLIGHSNQGHPFGVNLSDSDKSALIEYLKTL